MFIVLLGILQYTTPRIRHKQQLAPYPVSFSCPCPVML